LVNNVSAPSGVSSNDLMVILDSVFIFGVMHPVLIYHNYEFSRKHAYFIRLNYKIIHSEN